MKAFEFEGIEQRKTFYGDHLSVENGFAIIRMVDRTDHGPQRIVVAIHLAPGEWIADYSNTKVPQGELQKAV